MYTKRYNINTINQRIRSKSDLFTNRSTKYKKKTKTNSKRHYIIKDGNLQS